MTFETPAGTLPVDVACPLRPMTDMPQAAGGRGKEPLPQKLNELPDVGITNLDILDSLIPRPPKQRQKGKKQANRNHSGHSKHHRRNYLNKPSGRPT